MSNPIANPTGATRYVNVRQLITRFGCKCGTTQINKPFASKYCMRNCTEVNSTPLAAAAKKHRNAPSALNWVSPRTTNTSPRQRIKTHTTNRALTGSTRIPKANAVRKTMELVFANV